VERFTVESCATQQVKPQENNNMKLRNFKLLFELATLNTILNLIPRVLLFVLAPLGVFV
jgi:hypothetical protein